MINLQFLTQRLPLYDRIGVIWFESIFMQKWMQECELEWRIRDDIKQNGGFGEKQFGYSCDV